MARKSRKAVNQVILPAAPSEKIYRAGLYARISVENERKREADTIGNQIQLLKDFASENLDIDVVDIYVDDDISGTDFVRPEFSRMMNDIRDGKIDCVIVKDLSRLGRNLIETGEYIEMVFPVLSVRFIAITDRFDSKTMQVDIGVQIKNMTNEMYAKDASQKICSVMRSIQEQGKFAGSRAPYGYVRDPRDKHMLLADDETAPIVREMFEMVADGATLHYVATTLNERGVASPGRRLYETGVSKKDKYKNSMWYMQTVRRILQDRIYLGWMVSGKYASEFYITGQKGSKAVPPEEWIITKGTHEPIVTEELFNRVQEYFAKNKEEHALATKYDHKSKRESMFRGHLFCGECGKAMHIRRKVNHGRESYWYCCMIHEHYNSQYCSKKAVKSEQLESMVHTLIQNQMALYLDAKSIIAELNKKNTSQVRYKVYKEQINNLQRQIDRYMALKAALYEDYAEDTITAEDYVAMGQEYAQKADELRIFLSEIKKESRKYDPEYMGGEHWAKLVADFKDQKTLDRKMVEAFVNKLTLYNDGRAEIEFNFRDELEEVLLWAAMRKKEVNKYAG